MRVRSAKLLAVLVCTVLLSCACATAAFAETTPTVTPTETVPPPPAVTPSITVSAVGDMTFSSRVGSLVARRGPLAPFSSARGYLDKADVTIGNLETALSRRGRAVPGKKFTFRGNPSVTRGLSWAGFDLVALGNNHARDYGALALKDTLTNLDRADIAHAGAGMNRAQAFSPAIIERNGATVAYLSYSQIGPSGFSARSRTAGTAYGPSLTTVRSQVAAAKKRADYVIVSFHWGVERSYKPTSSQVRYGRAAIASGADAVLSHHPHVIQGVEFYRGKPIAYSLGNFVFSPGSTAGHDTMILSMTLSPDGVSDVKARAMHLDGAGRPVAARGGTARRINGIIARTSRGRGTKAVVRNGVVELSR